MGGPNRIESARSTSSSVRSARSVVPELREQHANIERESYKRGEKSFLQSGGTDTMFKLRQLQKAGRGLDISVSGWAGIQYTPQKFPNLFRGTTDKEINFIQTGHCLN